MLIVKLVILGFLGFFNWVGTPSSRGNFSSQGQSGTVMTLNNVSGFSGWLHAAGTWLWLWVAKYPVAVTAP